MSVSARENSRTMGGSMSPQRAEHFPVPRNPTRINLLSNLLYGFEITFIDISTAWTLLFLLWKTLLSRSKQLHHTRS